MQIVLELYGKLQRVMGGSVRSMIFFSLTQNTNAYGKLLLPV